MKTPWRAPSLADEDSTAADLKLSVADLKLAHSMEGPTTNPGAAPAGAMPPWQI